MTTAYHTRDLRAVTDPGPGLEPTDLPYKPPVPGLPSTPPPMPIEEPPVPAAEPPIGEPTPGVPMPSPVTI